MTPAISEMGRARPQGRLMMRIDVWRTIRVVLVGAAVAAGCGGSSPGSPSDLLSGTWSGSITDERLGAGTFAMTIAPLDALHHGTGTFAFGPQVLRSGAAYVTFAPPLVHLVVGPEDPPPFGNPPEFSLDATMAVVGREALRGTYRLLVNAVSGAEDSGGTIELRRETD